MLKRNLQEYFGNRAAVCALLFTFIFAFAQVSNAQKAQEFGVKGGIALTTLTHGNMGHIKPGLQLGGYAQLGGQHAFFFKAEFLVTQKGSWNWDTDSPRNYSLYYLELPLMYGVEVVDNLELNIGIQPAMLLGGTLRAAQEGGDTSTDPIGSDIARFDFSTIFGAEYTLNEKYFLGARFNYGFVPLQNYQGELTVDGQLLQNMALQFYLGLRLK